MRTAIETMLELQNRMNTKVHPEWIEQQFEWYRAVWIECGELMDHVGYKWWKHQVPDWEQVRLEVVDIWHFGMSALFRPGITLDVLADHIEEEFVRAQPRSLDVRIATEALAESSLHSKRFSVADFVQLMFACDLDFDALYRHYVGKNVLNFFRQDHGYKSGEYIKVWQGREDNEHLSEIMTALDVADDRFPDRVYEALETRYAAL
jgi:dimeric dUTPase (all-alpha-NTP-PPase superfamily)